MNEGLSRRVLLRRVGVAVERICERQANGRARRYGGEGADGHEGSRVLRIPVALGIGPSHAHRGDEGLRSGLLTGLCCERRCGQLWHGAGLDTGETILRIEVQVGAIAIAKAIGSIGEAGKQGACRVLKRAFFVAPRTFELLTVQRLAIQRHYRTRC